MIIELGKVVIDTSLDHEAHKKAIQKKTSFYCDEDKPIQWFTQPSPDRKGKDRYFHLRYNEEGNELKQITSYDYIDHTTHMVRRRKNTDEKCYFSKNKPQEVCDVYELVEETDYSSPVSTPDIIHWEKGMKEPAHQVLPITHKTRKKKWGLF